LYTPDGRESFPGFASADPASDVERVYRHPGWINVDDRLGLVFCGTGSTHYLNRHHFPTWWAVADDLVLSRLNEPLRARSGAVIGKLTAAIAPGHGRARTGALRPVELRGPRHTAGLLLGGYLVAANFLATTRIVQLRCRWPRPGSVPVFAGITRIGSGRVSYALELPPFRPALRQVLCEVEVSGPVEIAAAVEGRVVALNPADRDCRVGLAGDARTVRLRPGGSAVLR
ncbi:MAG: hypothetical protein ABH877_00930, partial [bacterium]